MKRVLLLTVSLTVISMVLFTKWWKLSEYGSYTAHGFPMVHSIPCLHTSLCTQYFVRAVLINITVHLIFWGAVIVFAKRYISPSVWTKRLAMGLQTVAIILVVLVGLYFLVFEGIYMWEPDYPWEVLDSGLEIFFNRLD